MKDTAYFATLNSLKKFTQLPLSENLSIFDFSLFIEFCYKVLQRNLRGSQSSISCSCVSRSFAKCV